MAPAVTHDDLHLEISDALNKAHDWDQEMDYAHEEMMEHVCQALDHCRALIKQDCSPAELLEIAFQLGSVYACSDPVWAKEDLVGARNIALALVSD